jgi:CheY-like chemotaxis protein
MTGQVVLVVEDGDEYLNVLTRFVPEYHYLQAHDGQQALNLLRTETIDLVYLDMRFDRTHEHLLLGDREKQATKFGGDEKRARRFLEKNQGLFILNHLCTEGFATTPMVLSHDFSSQSTRWQHLSRSYRNLSWLSDTLSPADIRAHFSSILQP